VKSVKGCTCGLQGGCADEAAIRGEHGFWHSGRVTVIHYKRLLSRKRARGLNAYILCCPVTRLFIL
jgi:hypothetical protein